MRHNYNYLLYHKYHYYKPYIFHQHNFHFKEPYQQSIALVAIVRRNLCGCILSMLIFLPDSRTRISTPLIFNLSYGASKVVNNAGLSSWRLLIFKYVSLDVCSLCGASLDKFLSSTSCNFFICAMLKKSAISFNMHTNFSSMLVLYSFHTNILPQHNCQNFLFSFYNFIKQTYAILKSHRFYIILSQLIFLLLLHPNYHLPIQNILFFSS